MSKFGLQETWLRLESAFRKRWDGLDRWIESRMRDSKEEVDQALVHAFKTDAAAIEDAPVPVSANAVLYVLVTLLGIAILWMIFGTLDRIVVAQGKVATRTPMVVMQPFTTSRITQVHVKAGDRVKKGDVLVSFDPAFALADLAALEQKVRGRAAEIDRIDAQMGGATLFPVSAADGAERLTQAQIFSQEMAQFSAEMSVRDSRVGAIDAQLRAVNANLPGLRDQLAMAQKVTSIQTYLVAQKAAAQLDLLRAQNAEIDAETRLRNALADSQKYAQQRAEVEAERRTYRDKWRSDHNQQLLQARQELAEAGEALNKARRMKFYTTLTAPMDATVLEIADRSVGSVLREAETLLTLVPDAASLYIEANVSSRDVSYVRVGSPVRIKFETYPFQQFGTVDGALDIISADSVSLKQGEESQLFYRGQVRITTPQVDLLKRGIRLRPGLVVTAEIKTGKRSIGSYILDPILRTSDESLREP